MTEQCLPEPCPFCGQVPSYQKTAFYGGEQSPSYVKCHHCNFYVAATGPGSDEKVLRLWNNRPIENRLRADVVLYKKEIDGMIKAMWEMQNKP